VVLRRALAILLVPLLGCAAAPAAPRPPPPRPTAELVLVGGTVVTNDPARPLAEAVAVHDGRIVAVGTRGEVQAHAAPGARRVELGGAFVLPGLVDAHAHLVGLGDALATLELGGTRSWDEVLERVREAAARQPGGWILGRGWDQNDWQEKAFPSGARLAEVAPGRAVWLRRIDGHAAVASPAALAAAQVDRTTPEPDGGRIVKDAAGEPTGVLVDAAMELVSRRIPPPPPAVQRERLLRALARAASVGLTGVHDMGLSRRSIDLYRELDRRRELPLRVYGVVAGDEPQLEEILRAGPIEGERFRLRALKLYADGALGSRGAALLADYADDPGNRGLLLTPPERIAQRVRAAVRAGFQPCVHAIGDRGNRAVLDAFEQALAGAASAHVRPRVEHAQLLALEDIPRFARLGAVASMQPTHATSDMPWAGARVGAERLRGAYAWRSLLAAGARLAFGSDFPVERPEPLEGLYAAISRADRDGKPPGGWRPEQRLRFSEALDAFTAGAAWSELAEQRRGRIRAGFDADFTVVAGDLGRLVRDEPGADAKALLGARIVATLVGGRLAAGQLP
jgi:hypothetical protein